MGVYLALSARILVNLESLNMAGSVGNVTKHRKAPVVYQAEDGTYRVVYVPVISGMSLAHHYQVLLARAAKQMNLNVPDINIEGYLLKYADDNIMEKYYNSVWQKINNKINELIKQDVKLRQKVEKAKNKNELDEIYDSIKREIIPCDIERIIVENDVVADVGGFLYTNGLVKRTSRFSFSYMVPALDAIKAAAVYPQLHVRYTPIARKEEQALIYVDNASALYTVSYVLEASEVSMLNVCKAMGQKPDDLGRQVRVERVKAAVDALIAMLGNMAFGAKRSRSLPHWKVQSIVVTASRGIAPFVPTPGHDAGYLESTLKRLEAQKQVIKEFEAVVHYYAAETLKGDAKGAQRHDTPEEAVKAAANWVISKL